MKIEQTKPIDIIYIHMLDEIAKWYEDNIDFALKQCISLHHNEIKGYNKTTGENCIQQTPVHTA